MNKVQRHLNQICPGAFGQSCESSVVDDCIRLVRVLHCLSWSHWTPVALGVHMVPPNGWFISWKIPFKWRIWVYPHLWKPPHGSVSSVSSARLLKRFDSKSPPSPPRYEIQNLQGALPLMTFLQGGQGRTEAWQICQRSVLHVLQQMYGRLPLPTAPTGTDH